MIDCGIDCVLLCLLTRAFVIVPVYVCVRVSVCLSVYVHVCACLSVYVHVCD